MSYIGRLFCSAQLIIRVNALTVSACFTFIILFKPSSESEDSSTFSIFLPEASCISSSSVKSITNSLSPTAQLVMFQWLSFSGSMTLNDSAIFFK
ncbi:hypothetical protein HHI36_000449 [Cryptolaemus montrouzieri]|uniref:Secreted protein n=1 Tax=Cryptolaemus montrouzieri TaxID=559131 RepID=A0ABD2P4N6_9CUCU